jgi:hypothetical protein
MKKEDDLKRCPFCGGSASLYIGSGGFYVRCNFCESRSTVSDTQDGAKQAWNERVTLKNSQWNKRGGFFYCAKCGCRQEKKTKFCAYCGAKMKDCKTYADYFDENFPKDKFPNADRSCICRRSLFGGYSEETLCEKGGLDCRECWEEVMEEQP